MDVANDLAQDDTKHPRTHNARVKDEGSDKQTFGKVDNDNWYGQQQRIVVKRGVLHYQNEDKGV